MSLYVLYTQCVLGCDINYNLFLDCGYKKGLKFIILVGFFVLWWLVQVFNLCFHIWVNGADKHAYSLSWNVVITKCPSEWPLSENSTLSYDSSDTRFSHVLFCVLCFWVCVYFQSFYFRRYWCWWTGILSRRIQHWFY